MNNKGFTMVELIASFSLTSIIVVMLLQIVFSLKEIQEYSDVKTELLTKQATISNKINKELYQKELKNIESCDDIPNYCLNFIYTDNSVTKLVIDKTNNTITIGDNKIKLVEGSYFDYVYADTVVYPGTDETKNDSILNINVEIKHKYFNDENFGLYVVYQYNLTKTPIVNVTLG